MARKIAIVEDEAAIRDNYVAAFEREAWTVLDTPFDRYLGGDRSALSLPEKRGVDGAKCLDATDAASGVASAQKRSIRMCLATLTSKFDKRYLKIAWLLRLCHSVIN